VDPAPDLYRPDTLGRGQE